MSKSSSLSSSDSWLSRISDAGLGTAVVILLVSSEENGSTQCLSTWTSTVYRTQIRNWTTVWHVGHCRLHSATHSANHQTDQKYSVYHPTGYMSRRTGTYPSIYQSNPIFSSIHPPIHPFFHLHFHPSILPPSVCLGIQTYTYLRPRQWHIHKLNAALLLLSCPYPSVHLSISPSCPPSLYLSIYSSTDLPLMFRIQFMVFDRE